MKLTEIHSHMRSRLNWMCASVELNRRYWIMPVFEGILATEAPLMIRTVPMPRGDVAMTTIYVRGVEMVDLTEVQILALTKSKLEELVELVLETPENDPTLKHSISKVLGGRCEMVRTF